MTEAPLATAPAFAAWILGPLRPCEWGLVILLLLALVRALSGPSPGLPLRGAFAAGLAGLLLLHALGEGARWQMVPLYLAVVALAAWLAHPVWPRIVGIPAAVGALGAAAGAIALAVTVPIFRLPPPDGPYPVGTRLYELVDAGRPDPHAGETGPRRLMVQLWYPAVKGTGRGPAAYRDAVDRWRLLHQRLIPTAASADAEIAPSGTPWPLVIFAHAWGGTRIQNTALMQALASNGFAVAAFDRPHNAGFVRFPDGRSVVLPREMALDINSDATLADALKRGAFEVELGAADASAVLDAVQAKLGQRIDARRAAIFGHSFGGAIAAEACIRDDRFVAAMNLDGWIFGRARAEGVPCPYLVMNDSTPVPEQPVNALARMQIDDRAAQLRSLTKYGGWDLTVAGSTHDDFTDRPFYALPRRLTGAGDRPPGQVEQVVRRYGVALAEWSLLDRRSTLLEAPGMTGVSLRAWPVTRRGRHGYG